MITFQQLFISRQRPFHLPEASIRKRLFEFSETFSCSLMFGKNGLSGRI